MKTLLVILAFLTFSNSYADNAYSNQLPDGRTRIDTFRDDGSLHQEYWSAPVNGRSYKSAEFDN